MKTIKYKTIEEAIKESRKEQNLSLVQLNKLTGITASYINRLENGERKKPSLDILLKLVKVLDIDLSSIEILPPSLQNLLDENFLDKETINTQPTSINNLNPSDLSKLLKFINSTNWNNPNLKFNSITELIKLLQDYQNGSGH